MELEHSKAKWKISTEFLELNLQFNGVQQNKIETNKKL